VPTHGWADDHDPGALHIIDPVDGRVSPGRHVRLGRAVQHQRALQDRVAELHVNEPSPAPVGGISHRPREVELVDHGGDLDHLAWLDVRADDNSYFGQSQAFVHDRILHDRKQRRVSGSRDAQHTCFVATWEAEPGNVAPPLGRAEAEVRPLAVDAGLMPVARGCGRGGMSNWRAAAWKVANMAGWTT